METLESLIEKLGGLSPNEINYVSNFDDIILEIAGLRDYRSIKLLISFFDDNSDYDELMFSVIHSIEQFDDLIYVDNILTSIKVLYENSPRWGSIVLMRIINSESTKEAFIKELLQGSDEIKGIVRDFLIKIGNKGKELSYKVSPIISRITEPSGA